MRRTQRANTQTCTCGCRDDITRLEAAINQLRAELRGLKSDHEHENLGSKQIVPTSRERALALQIKSDIASNINKQIVPMIRQVATDNAANKKELVAVRKDMNVVKEAQNYHFSDFDGMVNDYRMAVYQQNTSTMPDGGKSTRLGEFTHLMFGEHDGDTVSM